MGKPQAHDLFLFSNIDGQFLSQDPFPFHESLTQVDAISPWKPYDFSNIFSPTIGSLQTEFQAEGSVQSTMDPLVADAFSNAAKPENLTTPCSLAFSLITKNNLKGFSAAELDIKLRVGYRKALMPSEGCRVDNKVLFSVLAEIS